MQRFSIIIYLLIVFSFLRSEGGSGDFFDCIKDLKQMPMVIVSPYDGTTFAFWKEREEVVIERGLGIRHAIHYFTRVIDSEGRIVVDRRELKSWYLPPGISYCPYKFFSKTTLWLNSDRLLFIRARSPSGHDLEVERFIFSASGEIISSPDKSFGMPLNPSLVQDSKGKVYIVATHGVIGVEIAEVYPELGECIRTPEEHWEEFVKKYGSPLTQFSEVSVILISEDKLLICGRSRWGETPLENRTWTLFRPDKLFYVLADLKGKFVSEPVQFDLAEVAFRKIPGWHLGGMYCKFDTDEVRTAQYDLDFSKLPNGEIVLSATALDEDGKLCVYQVKFTPDGKLRKPKKLEITEPRFFSKGLRLPVVKVGVAEIWPGPKHEYILFGFDEEGNFYEDRMVWKEE